MSLANSSKFIVLSYKHVTNIDIALKNIKSDVMADFIKADHRDFTITTNKVASTLDLNTIKNTSRMLMLSILMISWCLDCLKASPKLDMAIIWINI